MLATVGTLGGGGWMVDGGRKRRKRKEEGDVDGGRRSDVMAELFPGKEMV